MVESVLAALVGLFGMVPIWRLSSQLWQRRFRRFRLDARSNADDVELDVFNPGTADHLVAEVTAVERIEERVSVPYVIPLSSHVAEIPEKSTRVLRLATAKLLSAERNTLGTSDRRYGAFELVGASPVLVHIAGYRNLDDLFEWEIALAVRITGKDTGRRRDAYVVMGFDMETGKARCRLGRAG